MPSAVVAGRWRSATTRRRGRPAEQPSNAQRDREGERPADRPAAQNMRRHALLDHLQPREEEEQREAEVREKGDELVDVRPAQPSGPITIPSTISTTTVGRTTRVDQREKSAPSVDARKTRTSDCAASSSRIVASTDAPKPADRPSAVLTPGRVLPHDRRCSGDRQRLQIDLRRPAHRGLRVGRLGSRSVPRVGRAAARFATCTSRRRARRRARSGGRPSCRSPARLPRDDVGERRPREEEDAEHSQYHEPKASSTLFPKIHQTRSAKRGPMIAAPPTRQHISASLSRFVPRRKRQRARPQRTRRERRRLDLVLGEENERARRRRAGRRSPCSQPERGGRRIPASTSAATHALGHPAGAPRLVDDEDPSRSRAPRGQNVLDGKRREPAQVEHARVGSALSPAAARRGAT